MVDGITIVGDKKLKKMIERMNNPADLLDPAFAKTARQSLREIGENTQRKSGNTARAWTNPKKGGPSKYYISNDVRTPDKQHLLVDILNKGRGRVFPVRAKKLYIPLTEKGRSKPIGAPIPPGLVYGVDYVRLDRVGPYKGTRFLDHAVKNAGKLLKKSVIAIIGKVKRGQ